MDTVQVGNGRLNEIVVLDEPGQGNACHEYEVKSPNEPTRAYSRVSFQNGPIDETGGINGCFNEDLIAIVIHRLRGFQSGAFVCRENALALTKLEEALHWLNHRTNERIKRGVEGKTII